MEFLHRSAILVIAVASLSCIAHEMKCPANFCICKVENGTTDYISDCSNSSLTDFPRGLDPQSTILNVSHNNITEIKNSPDYEEGILHIDRVASKYSHEEGVEDGVLRSLSSLKELHLESNLLAEIEPGALDGNPELLILDLSDNNLTSLPVDVIRLDNKIHQIDISGNAIEEIDMSSVQSYYPELLEFDVSRNQLKHITSVSPSEGSILEVFDLSSNYLVDLSDAFTNATKLKKVNVSNNEIEELSPDVFRDNPDLVSVDVSKNHIVEIHKDVFSNLEKIVDIRAGSNKITFINPDVFSNNPHLTNVIVSWNNIEEIHPDTFKNNPNLQYVDFRSNNLKSVSPDTFDGNPELKSIDLRSNSLLTIEKNTFHNNPQLEHLLLSKNEHIRFHDGFKIRSKVLKIFDVEHCNLTKLPEGILNEASGLKELNLANNNVSSLGNITDGYSETVTKLEILDLSNNNLQTIDIDVYSNKLTHLKELRIAGNSFLCNCTLRTLWLWSQKEGIVPAEPQIMCYNGMNTVPWDELRDYNCSDEALLMSNKSVVYERILEDQKRMEPSLTDVEDTRYSGVVSEHDAHRHRGHGYDIDHDRSEVPVYYVKVDNTAEADLDRSNRIMIGISLFILLAVTFLVLPLIFILRKKRASYKITKPIQQPIQSIFGATEQKPGLTDPSSA